jgi:hypothetical protein
MADAEKQLKCDYSTQRLDNAWSLYGSFQYCKILNADLSNNSLSESYSFTGTEQEKLETTGIYFTRCPNTVHFIPQNIATELPNLKEFLIVGSNIPTLKDNLFTKSFENLQFVSLGKNNIKEIEEHAFSKLPKLKWLGLWYNLLETIKSHIFANNLDLQFVYLNGNRIKILNVHLFKGLGKLKYFYFNSNVCVSEAFGCETCMDTVSQTELDNKLQPCFSNCLSDAECSSNISKKTEEIPSITDSPSIKEENLNETISKNQCTVFQSNFENINLSLHKIEENDSKKFKEIKDISKNVDELKSLIIGSQNLTNNYLNIEKENSIKSVESLESFDTKLESTVTRIDASNKETVQSLRNIVINTTESKLEIHCRDIQKEIDKTIELINAKLEMEKLKFDLKEANYINDKKAMEIQVKSLEDEVKKLNERLEKQAEDSISREKTLKEEIVGLIKDQFEEFERNLRNEVMA